MSPDSPRRARPAAPPVTARLAALLLPAALLAAAGCASLAPPTGPWTLQATDPAGTPLPGGVQTYRAEGIALEIRSLTDAERTAFLTQRAGAAGDVFAGGIKNFLTFRLTVAATGNVPAHVETQSIRLLPNGGSSMLPPLDYTRAFELLRPERGTLPSEGMVETLMRGVFDGPIDLAAGQSLEGLLIFVEPEGTWDILFLDVPFIQAGAETGRSRFYFQKKYEGEATPQ
jgi:hypothetical protein